MKKKVVNKLPAYIPPPDNKFWFYIGAEYFIRMQEPPPYKLKIEKYFHNIKKVKELCVK